MLKELLISATVIAGFASAASAQTCATPPSCASLGYTLTAPKGDGWVCTGCPFDPTKFACTAKPCPTGARKQSEITGLTCVSDNGTLFTLNSSFQTNGNFALCIAGHSGDTPCYTCPSKISIIYSGSSNVSFTCGAQPIYYNSALKTLQFKSNTIVLQ